MGIWEQRARRRRSESCRADGDEMKFNVDSAWKKRDRVGKALCGEVGEGRGRAGVRPANEHAARRDYRTPVVIATGMCAPATTGVCQKA